MSIESAAEESSAAEFTHDEIVKRLPAFLEAVSLLDSRDPALLDVAFGEAGLIYSPRRAARRRPGSRDFDVSLSEEAPSTFERRLRTAVTKVLGKPAGTDKHWDLGLLIASMTLVNNIVGIHLRPQLSMRELRDAAADWLAGTAPDAWLHAHGLDAPDARSSEHGGRVTLYEGDSGSLRGGLSMDPGVRPPLSRPTSDDENLELTWAYLPEALGDPQSRGEWRRGARSFSFRRMSSRSRAISFVQDAVETVDPG